jgi:DNA-binding SARP family transcriptional activator/tetratricopeptide (TPR) repeat protein
MRMASELRIQVFGGLRAWRDGRELSLGPLRQQIVLAALVAAEGDRVSLDRLVSVLWSGDAPATAANQIHRHIGELRRVLDPDLRTRETGCYILPAADGYRLDVERVHLDLQTFREAVAEAQRSAAQGDLVRARSGYRTALEIARSPAFAGLGSRVGLGVGAGLDGAARARSAAAVAAAKCCERSGEAEAMLPAVERVAASSPMDEALQAGLIRLRHLAGHRAAALQLFEQVKQALGAELGVGPGAELRAAHLAVLTSGHGANDKAGDPPVVVSSTLPSALVNFVARAGMQSRLDEAVISDGSPLVAVTGMAGIGKTSLVIRWAHSLKDRFPDGAIYLDLRGFEAPEKLVAPYDALGALLEALGVPSLAAPKTVEARADRLRSLVSTRRVLVVLDNAKDAEQVRPLLLGEPRSLVIVTSRDQLLGLAVHDGATLIPLDKWDPDAARALIAARVGSRRVHAEPDAVRSIVRSCGGLPLALSMVGARAAFQPDLSLQDIAEELVPTAGRLSAIGDAVGEDLSAAFGWSYRALTEPAARLFRHLAVHPGPQMSLASLASVIGETVKETRVLTRSLISANMLTEASPDRFVLHDLLRVYAERLLESSRESEEGCRRLIEHYVAATRQVSLVFGRPSISPGGDGERPESVERFDSTRDAVVWYQREAGVLRECVRMCEKFGLAQQAASIVLDWRPVALDTAGQGLPYCRMALDLLPEGERSLLRAELLRDLAGKLARSGDLPAARRHYEDALSIAVELDDHSLLSNIYRNMSWADADKEEGLRHLESAVEAAELAGSPYLLEMALVVLASFWIIEQKKEWEKARAVALRALEISSGRTDDHMRPTILWLLGLSDMHLGAYREALAYAAEGLDLVGDGPMVVDQSYHLSLQAVAAEAVGDSGLAEHAARRFDELYAVNGAVFDEEYQHLPEVREAIARILAGSRSEKSRPPGSRFPRPSA